ncbi:MAG: hypothetical protein Q4C00_06060, partial [Bacillota bacterium]|nr:hypothetical protein [Bacillota bacterium]
QTSISMNDGYFEAGLVKKTVSDFFNATTMLGAAVAQQLIDIKYVYNFKTSRMIVRSDEGIPWTLDGEFGGVCTEAVIECKKEALEIITPRRLLTLK